MGNFLHFWRPRSRNSDSYPLDLDGSLRYTRMKSGNDYFPVPPQIGMVSGILQQMDMFVYRSAMGKIPYGPGTTQVPVNLQWQMTIPGLTKMG